MSRRPSYVWLKLSAELQRITGTGKVSNEKTHLIRLVDGACRGYGLGYLPARYPVRLGQSSPFSSWSNHATRIWHHDVRWYSDQVCIMQATQYACHIIWSGGNAFCQYTCLAILLACPRHAALALDSRLLGMNEIMAIKWTYLSFSMFLYCIVLQTLLVSWVCFCLVNASYPQSGLPHGVCMLVV